MIFGSLGLLVVAVAMLIAAILKSSVPFGVGSLVCTLGAMVLLFAANAYYRRMTLLDPEGERLRELATEGGAAGRLNGNGNGNRRSEALRQPTQLAAEAPLPASRRVGPPVDGYPDLADAQAVKVVDTLNLEELHELRRYEVEHANRKRVLTAIDRRVDTIISLRRSLASS